jgi:hypothetical protein
MKPERFFQLACRQPAAGTDGGSLAAEILESFQRYGYSIGRMSATPDRPLTDDELDRRIEAALDRVMGKTSRDGD